MALATCVSERGLPGHDESRVEASNALMLGIPRPVSFSSSLVVTRLLCSRLAPGDADIAYATGLAGGGDVASREYAQCCESMLTPLPPEHARIVYGIEFSKYGIRVCSACCSSGYTLPGLVWYVPRACRFPLSLDCALPSIHIGCVCGQRVSHWHPTS